MGTFISPSAECRSRWCTFWGKGVCDMLVSPFFDRRRLNLPGGVKTGRLHVMDG